jgi:hypothetical protein
MYDDPGLEQRLSRFEAQLDRFSLALHQWQTHDRSHAVPDVDHRIRTLEETLGREAHALRLMHEEPLKQLQAHAAHLQDLCAKVQTLLADLQNGRDVPAPPPPKAPAWPLERVVHLHDELRRTGNGHGDRNGHDEGNRHGILTLHDPSRQESSDDATRGRRQRSFVESLNPSDDSEARRRRQQYIAGGVAATVLVVLVFGAVSWVGGRLDEAASRVASAERQVVHTTKLANEEVRSAREDATRQIAEAREVAQRAETVGVILAAPDLIRFNLTSTLDDGSSAQVLWSRTRGIVLSASRLPAAGTNKTYQLWLVTNGPTVSAGVFEPDPTGRATLVVDAAPKIPGPVVGAAITVEPTGGRSAPSGQMLLTRFP